jgi:outer membrane protein assembly factor BamD (BamD/ComL family)
MKKQSLNWLKKSFKIGSISLAFVVGISGTHRAQAQSNYGDQRLRGALSLYEKRQLIPAASALFSIRTRPELKAYKGLIYLTLGKIFLELNFPQIAAWQFANVIMVNDQNYNKKALEYLSIAADRLGDETILNYAVSKMKISEFPAQEKDMLFFRMGEIKFRNKDFKGAIEAFDRVTSDSNYSEMADYMSGSSFASLNDTNAAISKFEALLANKRRAVTDNTRVSTIMALARAYYQKKDWFHSLEYYRRVPRDHNLWHNALFESAWANLRDGKFRSALGIFHSLHSSYYDDFYVPESLVLRAIVYLYICKYDEVNKVVGLFERSYGDVQARLTNFLRSTNDPRAYYDEIEHGLLMKKMIQDGKKPAEGRIPYRVIRHILGKPDIERGLDYLRKLFVERQQLENMSVGFLESPLGKYTIKLLIGRIKTAQKLIGIKAKIHMIYMKGELKDLDEQVSYLRYEMIGLQKDMLKKKISGQAVEAPKIDDDSDRSYYVKNGYDYWPFQGEFWLDEIGNYFYVGKQSCEN